MSIIVDEAHNLLEQRSPAYSNATVRRAFVVWMCCAQRNQFKDVCNYYHYLEAFEDKLPPERRALSRHHEFNLFSNRPPTSTYLVDNFPNLYKESCIETHPPKPKETQNEKFIFKLEEFQIAPKKGTTTKEIVEASQMIRKYCKTQMISLKTFLENFRQYARKCGLKYTVNNVAFYIKRKMVQDEIELEANYPKTLGFLNGGSVENIFNDIPSFVSNNQNKKVDSKNVSDDIPNSVSKNQNDTKNDSNCQKVDSKATDDFKPIKILRKDDVSILEKAKNCWSHNNNINILFRDKKEVTVDDSHMIINDHVKRTQDIEDWIEDDVPLKKERRFSGSRFMKIELEKFRKI